MPTEFSTWVGIADEAYLDQYEIDNGEPHAFRTPDGCQSYVNNTFNNALPFEKIVLNARRRAPLMPFKQLTAFEPYQVDAISNWITSHPDIEIDCYMGVNMEDGRVLDVTIPEHQQMFDEEMSMWRQFPNVNFHWFDWGSKLVVEQVNINNMPLDQSQLGVSPRLNVDRILNTYEIEKQGVGGGIEAMVLNAQDELAACYAQWPQMCLTRFSRLRDPDNSWNADLGKRVWIVENNAILEGTPVTVLEVQSFINRGWDICAMPPQKQFILDNFVNALPAPDLTP